ncbi:hypothetical protein [Phaeovulum sp. NW3]|uniref:hypothetical protein n=1 Tax=Phaeovulum sp. NW3 TaxID=2934933 RepID=UPI002020BBFD|nr:hypothetical protein [Phaeovulum sp. NW3]MCL7466030.1 hypothetical protein [Phaeovulum sp. NW3]
MRPVPALILPLFLLAACNDPGFTGVAGVRAADATEVAGCTLVSRISMKPEVYGPLLADQGLRYARNKIMDQARQDGASHVVFERVEPGQDVYLVRADAYRCP